jgi:hypothetical protein
MKSKLDHSKIARSPEGDVLMTYYAFQSVHAELKKNDIEHLCLEVDGERQTTESGLRNFLMRIASVDWNLEVMSKPERQTLERIRHYLENPKGVEKKVQASGMSVEEAIAKHESDMKKT